MEVINGFTAYTIIIKRTDEPRALQLIDERSALLSLTAEYKISGKTEDYTILQVDAVYQSDSSRPLTKFITNTFDFIAIHQEGTNYILVEYEDDWEAFCLDVYDIERDIKMIYYHTMSINERYESYIKANPCLKMCMDLSYEKMDRITKAIYQLDFEKDAEWLFQDEEDLCLFDNATMIHYSVEAIDGIDKDQFKVAILNKKS